MNKAREEKALRCSYVDGRVPNARDRWEAFWRLWRITQRHPSQMAQIQAEGCFHTLMLNPAAIRLASSRGDFLVLNHSLPVWARWQAVRSARRSRIELLLSAIFAPVVD